jgi:integrase
MRQIVLYDAAGKIKGRKLIYDYRGLSGASQKVSTTLKAEATIRDITLAQAELIRRAENRSLTSSCRTKFEDVVDITRKNECRATHPIYERIRKELAGVIGPAWVQKYNRFCDKLETEGKAINTISNYKACIRFCLNTAYRRHLIDDNPIRDMATPREFRKRVLSADEWQRLENLMIACNSPLLWSARFSKVRPIRENDLWGLTRENLILFGDLPHIRFWQQKTETTRKIPVETVLPLADLPEMLSYFQSLPSGTFLLFPGKGGHRILKPGTHWKRLLSEAKIEDFHWHDLKRMATMHMLAAGYTVEEIIKLGIYARPDMIMLCYDQTRAVDIMARHAPVVLLSSLKEGAR